MFPHPDTVCVLKAMDHRETLAACARARRAARARPANGGPPVMAAVRGRLGVALVGLGMRLKGTREVEPASGRSVAVAPMPGA